MPANEQSRADGSGVQDAETYIIQLREALDCCRRYIRGECDAVRYWDALDLADAAIDARPVPTLGEREWKLPLRYRTSVCKWCGGIITFKHEGKRIWVLDVDKARTLERDRGRMAPQHRCTGGVGPRG